MPSTAPAGPEGSTDQRKGNRSWSQANLGTEHTFETPLLSNWMTLDGESNILVPHLLPYVKLYLFILIVMAKFLSHLCTINSIFFK